MLCQSFETAGLKKYKKKGNNSLKNNFLLNIIVLEHSQEQGFPNRFRNGRENVYTHTNTHTHRHLRIYISRDESHVWWLVWRHGECRSSHDLVTAIWPPDGQPIKHRDMTGHRVKCRVTWAGRWRHLKWELAPMSWTQDFPNKLEGCLAEGFLSLISLS